LTGRANLSDLENLMTIIESFNEQKKPL